MYVHVYDIFCLEFLKFFIYIFIYIYLITQSDRVYMQFVSGGIRMGEGGRERERDHCVTTCTIITDHMK